MEVVIYPVLSTNRNICLATSPGRCRGIYIVYKADVYEGMHIPVGSIMRQVFLHNQKNRYVYVYIGNTTVMYVCFCLDV
jgi:hypothetical protein